MFIDEMYEQLMWNGALLQYLWLETKFNLVQVLSLRSSMSILSSNDNLMVLKRARIRLEMQNKIE